MATDSVPGYLEYESAVADALTNDDELNLIGIEEDWAQQARASAGASDVQGEMEEWAAWIANSPAYRAIAYAQNFDAGGIPAVLQIEVPNWRSTPELQPIIDKVLNAENAGAPSSSGGQIVGIGATGLVIVAALAFLLLSGGRK